MLPSWVISWCYQQMLDQTGKFLPGANTLAYWASLLATKKKSFIMLTPGGCPRLFRPHFSLNLVSFVALQPSIAGSVLGGCSRLDERPPVFFCLYYGHCYKAFFVHNLRIFVLSQSFCSTRLETLAWHKYSSLLRKQVNYRQKQFYNIQAWG